MTISRIEEDALEQECVRCKQKTAVSFDDIEVGLQRGKRFYESIIQIPPCPQCAAVEYLIRSQDDGHPAAGSFGHLHRLLTNTLHARLVKRGRVAEGILPGDITVHEPEEQLEVWFKDGLKLSRGGE
jgi:hypothetical protein